MRSGTPVFLYLAALCTLGLVAHMWWRSGQRTDTSVADELRPIRQELREVRSEMEEMSRVTLKQQAALYKIEALLDLQGGAAPRAAAAAPAPVPHAAVPDTAPPPPPPPMDDRALSAFVQTQAAARQEASSALPLSVPAAAAAPVAAVAAPPAAPAEQRRTVVFSSTSTGSVMRTGSPAPAVVRPQPVLPPASDGLSLEDIAALVSTVSVQAAQAVPPRMTSAPRTQTVDVAAPPLPDAETRAATAPATVAAVPQPAARTTVDAADPSLPGAAPVPMDMTRVAVDEPAPAADAPAPPAAAAAPRRVTTVPSLTADPQPDVPAVRPSRVARDERARAADITSSLSLSDRFTPAPGQRAKVTISDVLNAQNDK